VPFHGPRLACQPDNHSRSPARPRNRLAAFNWEGEYLAALWICGDATLLPSGNRLVTRPVEDDLHQRSHIREIRLCKSLGRSVFFGSGDCPVTFLVLPGQKHCTSAILLAQSPPLSSGRGYGDCGSWWVLYRFASMKFCRPGRARGLTGQSPLPKNTNLQRASDSRRYRKTLSSDFF
jgi:hypothetical protein